VLGVAIGASLAAVVIIVLTLVFLCMWSRRWRQNQDKVSNGFMEQLKTMPFPIMMQDRIRWAQYAEAMAASNLYAVSCADLFTFFDSFLLDKPDTIQRSDIPHFQHPHDR
jgi:K+-transporting ATPase A subunit